MREISNTAVIRDTESGQWIRYRDPLNIIQTTDIHEVFSKLEVIEHTVQKQGLHAVGFISYEASPAFDRALQTYKLTSFPLLWFGLFDKFEVIELPKPVSDSSNILFRWESSLTPVSTKPWNTLRARNILTIQLLRNSSRVIASRRR